MRYLWLACDILRDLVLVAGSLLVGLLCGLAFLARVLVLAALMLCGMLWHRPRPEPIEEDDRPIENEALIPPRAETLPANFQERAAELLIQGAYTRQQLDARKAAVQELRGDPATCPTRALGGC